MNPPRSCPHREACEIIGCSLACKPQALALTPPPIPLGALGLEGLSSPERGVVWLHDALDRLFRRRRPRAPEAEPGSAPFLPAPEPEAPPLSDALTFDTAGPPAPMTPAPSLPARRPTNPVQIVPAARGGFVLVVDGALTAVAGTADELAEVCREWARGGYL